MVGKYVCKNKYMGVLAVYLMIIVFLTLNISIDIPIGAPVYGKDVVYGLNAKDKIYMRE